MGLLRKLAGLVVEFPAEAEKKPATEDVASTIEAIRRDLESGVKTDFEKGSQSQGGEPAATPPGGTQADPLAPPAQALSGIRLPELLGIPEIYARAQIKSDPAGFSIEKVAEMLADPEIAPLPLPDRARSVRMALKTMGKDLRLVLEDAARRDKALDDYLVYLEHRAGQVAEQVQAANAALEQEIAAFTAAKRAVIEQNKARGEEVQRALGSFKTAKQAEEQRLFDLAAPFVAAGQNPVIVDESAEPGAQPGPKGEKK